MGLYKNKEYYKEICYNKKRMCILINKKEKDYKIYF